MSKLGILVAMGFVATAIGCTSNGNNVTCTPPTVLSADGTMCIFMGPDAGVGPVCGANEMLSADGKTCVIANGACGANLVLMNGMCVATASICQAPGTVFDAKTSTCKQQETGTQLATANFTHDYHHVFYVIPDGGAPDTDAGTGTDKIQVIGNFDTQVAQIPATTPIVNKFGKKLGAFTVSTISPMGPNVLLPTAINLNDLTKFWTIGDYNACGGTVAWYKPSAKVNGKSVYKQVIDVAGCMPQSLYTVWNFYTPDKTRASALFVSAAGGIPNTFVTDDNGTGHWERLQDADIWFKSGIALPYAGTHTPPAQIPDLSTNPMFSLVTSIAYHSNAQTNGNIGFCVKDATNNCNGGPCCATPQPQVLSVGNAQVDVHHMLIAEGAGAVPLTMLQPY